MNTTIELSNNVRTIGLKVADAVWIATALLHDSHPEAAGFSPSAIREEVLRRHFTDKDQKTIYQHIVQHLVATKPKDPNSRKMLTEIENGLRRLYIPGDPFHPSKQNGRSVPKAEDLPRNLLKWLAWYETWSRNHSPKRPPARAVDPMEALEGTWTFGDGDTYLREMREGWEGRS